MKKYLYRYAVVNGKGIKETSIFSNTSKIKLVKPESFDKEEWTWIGSVGFLGKNAKLDIHPYRIPLADGVIIISELEYNSLRTKVFENQQANLEERKKKAEKISKARKKIGKEFKKLGISDEDLTILGY